MSTKALIGVLLAGTVGIVIFLFVHLSSDPSKGIDFGPKKAMACNKAKDSCLPEVKYVDTSGRAYSAESLAGKVVVVNFWATWCHPCQKEIPDLSKTYDKYKGQGVVFLGVVTDQASDNDLLNFQSDYEMTYPIVRANSDILVSYNYPQALPTTFVFDRGGRQVDSHVGPLSESSLDRILQPLVAQK